MSLHNYIYKLFIIKEIGITDFPDSVNELIHKFVKIDKID